MSDTIDIKDISIEVTPESIESIDTETLRETFMKSVSILEAALFSQAGKEYERVEKLRRLLNDLEDSIFSSTVFSTLSNKEKISLHTTISRNSLAALSFLTKLHDSVASGMETISSLENRKASQVSENRKLVGEDDTILKENIMELLRNKIIEKSEEGE